jgi:hypothetical protein
MNHNHGWADAQEIRGKNWIGLSVPDEAVRCYSERGYEGMGDGASATLFCGELQKEVALFGPQCEKFDAEGIKLVLQGFEFIPAAKSQQDR